MRTFKSCGVVCHEFKILNSKQLQAWRKLTKFKIENNTVVLNDKYYTDHLKEIEAIISPLQHNKD